jgi:glycine cleavage system H lipoate-binding protein
MFPFVYGFTWDAGNLIFLGLFFTVVTIVFVTFGAGALRAFRDLRSGRAEEIQWDSDFQELPATARLCRHHLAGRLPGRVCENRFDCSRCGVHQHLCALQPARPEVMTAGFMFGFRMPLDRWYDRGHTWVREERDGTVTIGLDDLGRRLIGTPEAVILPEPGEELTAHGTAARIRRGSADVRILSPVGGVVVARGGVSDDWLLRVRMSEPLKGMHHLLCGEEVRSWLMREFERLQRCLAGTPAGITLADGGVPLEDMSAAVPAERRDRILGEMFLEP